MSFTSLTSRDVDLPPDTYDVRGWDVRTRRDDLHVGTVDDMLLDAEGWPRYLDVDVVAGGKHVLVPLERATAEPNQKQVWIRGLTADRFEALPSWAGDVERLGEDYEARLLEDWHRAEHGDVREDATPRTALARLSEMDDFKVASGSSDVRGWTILLGDGRKLGTVAELLFDRDDMKVRYIDCDVYEDKLELERVDRHVLLPIEHVRLDAKHRHVVVDGLFAADLADYPVYGGLPLGDDHLRLIHDRFRPRRHETSERSRSAADAFFRRRRRAEVGEGARVASVPAHDREAAADEGVSVSPDGDAAVVRKDGQEVRIRITGDDIVIEKGSGGEVRRG